MTDPTCPDCGKTNVHTERLQDDPDLGDHLLHHCPDCDSEWIELEHQKPIDSKQNLSYRRTRQPSEDFMGRPQDELTREEIVAFVNAKTRWTNWAMWCFGISSALLLSFWKDHPIAASFGAIPFVLFMSIYFGHQKFLAQATEILKAKDDRRRLFERDS